MHLVRPYVRPSVSYGLLVRKLDEIGVNVPRGGLTGVLSVQKVKFGVTVCQKGRQNDRNTTYTCYWRIMRRRPAQERGATPAPTANNIRPSYVSAPETLGNCTDGRVHVRIGADVVATACIQNEQDRQALLKAKYCPRVMPVQHFVNPGQLVQAVSCTHKTQEKPT